MDAFIKDQYDNEENEEDINSFTKNQISETENEQSIREKWGKFVLNNNKTSNYTIVCPPPNVTGNLHLGHCVSFSIIDMVARQKYLQGKKVYVEGGSDHAAIATTMMIRKHYGNTLNAENFDEKAKEWIENSQDKIKQQIKDLGVLMDWQNFCYTIDEKRSYGVIHAFNILYNKGLIFKSKKIINWDTFFGTALSDLEVKIVEEQGYIYKINYYFDDNEQNYITVSTTRPETIFADCAIAINPDDNDKKHLIGKYVRIPLIDKKIPIIAHHSVKKDFGTGFLKITPAHSFVDYDIWNDTPLIKDINPIDLLNDNGILVHEILPKDFLNLTVKEARKLIVEKLQLQKEITHHFIPYSDRSNTLVEPKITEQWFLDLRGFTNDAMEILDELLTFVPHTLINNYKSWLNNLQLWCISRNLPLGHKIPIWYDEDENIYCAHNYEEALHQAQKKSNNKNINLRGETATLDTWFSSGIFHKTVLDWPTENETNYSKLFPADLLITGYDILFFWVTRMILMSLALQDGELKNRIAFKFVLLHGLIRDKLGNKMSKTKGNSIDPYEISNKYGFDNLRLTLLLNSINSNDLRVDENSFIQTQKIFTKLKNAHIYCKKFSKNVNIDSISQFLRNNKENLKPTVKGIVGITNSFIKRYHDLMIDLQINKTLKLALYDFFYSTFCDKFIEIHKNFRDKDKRSDLILMWAFRKVLQMLHPSIPFITEEYWQSIFNTEETMLNSNLEVVEISDSKEFAYGLNNTFAFISIIRFFQKSFNCKNLNISLEEFKISSNEDFSAECLNIVAALTKTTIKKNTNNRIKYIDRNGNIWILSNLICEQSMVDKEIEKLNDNIKKISNLINNEEFLQKAEDKIILKYKNMIDSDKTMLNCLKQVTGIV